MRESVGERIRSMRRSRGIQRRQLAELAGCPAQHLAEIEEGGREPSLSLLRRLALGLRVPAGDLLDGVDTDQGDYLSAFLSSAGDWSTEETDALRGDIEAIVRLHRARKLSASRLNSVELE